MLNFGVLLFLGVLTGTLAAESYSHTYTGGGGYSQGETSYANSQYESQQGYSSYGQSQAGYGTYGQGQTGYGYGYGTSVYSSSCRYTKVSEVLDSIFCEHGIRKRYSSTIYPAIELVTNQLEYLLELTFLQPVFDLLGAAKQTLETLQDALYSNYEGSPLLDEYNEDVENPPDETSETSHGGKSTSSKLAAAEDKLEAHETKAKRFKTAKGLHMKKRARPSSSHVKGATKQRANEDDDALLDLTLVSVGKSRRTTPERDDALIKKLQGAMAKLKREAADSSRKPRGSEYKYTDNSCTYLSATYCDTDKYDELLYNILDRLFTALEFLDFAAWEISDFIEQIGCSTEEDRLALEEAAIVYGGIITNFYTLLEVATKVEKMYKLVELDYGYDNYDISGYYRAGGGSSSQSQPQMVAVQMARRPMVMAAQMPINKTPASQRYSFPQYMSQSQAQPQTPVTYASYSVPQQQPYRVGRAPQQISVPVAAHNIRPSSRHAPAIFLVG